MTNQEILENYPNDKFIGIIKVGLRGIKEIFHDKQTYNKRYDKVWDSGFDLEARVLRDI